VSTEHKAMYELTMQIKLLDEVLGVSASSKELMCLPIIFDITAKYGGSTATDIANIAGLPYSSVGRYLKSYEKAGLITYGVVSSSDRNKYVHLTAEGEALRLRVSNPTDHPKFEPLLNMQVEAQLASIDRGTKTKAIMDAAEEMAKTGLAQPVHHTLKLEDTVAAKAEVGQVSIYVQDADGNPKTIKDALAMAKTPKQVKDVIAEHKAAQDEHVMKQVLRAVRNAAVHQSSMVKWRDVPIQILDPQSCVDAYVEGGGQRIQNNGIWMLYPKHSNPATTLPMAVQTDMPDETFEQLVKEKVNDLTAHEVAGTGFVTLKAVMEDLRILLNERQYNKARMEITSAVADFSHQMREARAKHEQFVKESIETKRVLDKQAEELSAHGALVAHSPTERMEFERWANQKRREAAMVEEGANKSKQTIEQLNQRLEEVNQAAAARDRERDLKMQQLEEKLEKLTRMYGEGGFGTGTFGGPAKGDDDDA
jgi:DNA-binding MarR family transcriptional regulator